MHPALYVDEIASLIVSYIPLWDSPKRDTHSLAALATTCKLLSMLSLDELWSFQVGLDNLIKCMPADLWDFMWEQKFHDLRVRTLVRLLYVWHTRGSSPS